MTPRLPWRPLDPDTVELLTDGNTTGRYNSNSDLAQSLALRFRNAGRTRDDYIDAMTDTSNGASVWYRQMRDGRSTNGSQRRKSPRGRDKAIRELQRCWAKAASMPLPRGRLDASDVMQRVLQVTDAALVRLSGRTRPTRLRVLDAVCQLAIQHSTDRPLAAVRTVALAAGVSTKTASVALRDLVDVGLLRRVGTTDSYARTYELCTYLTQTQHTAGSGKSVTDKCIQADCWRHRDLGAPGLLVWQTLGEDQQRVVDIAAVSGLHRNTVSRRLRSLADRGLAVEVEDRWWCRGAADPLTAPTIAAGTGQREAERFARERANHRRAGLRLVTVNPPVPRARRPDRGLLRLTAGVRVQRGAHTRRISAAGRWVA